MKSRYYGGYSWLRKPDHIFQMKRRVGAQKLPSQPNIIFLIIDSLRYDRLSCNGHLKNLTPTLDQLCADGVTAQNFFANGPATQFAFPSIFTSTLPLSHGGYNSGILSRPVSLPEVLSRAEYECWGVVTGHPCSSRFHYNRGFSTFYDMVDLYQWFRSVYKTGLRELLERWKLGELTKDDLQKRVIENYASFLADTESFIIQMEQLGVPQSGRSRKKLLPQIRQERALLESEPLTVCEKLLLLDQNYQYALGIASVTPNLLRKFEWRRRLRDAINSIVSIVSERRAFTAPVVNDLFSQFLKTRDRKKPFFALLHYFDLHEAKLLISAMNLKKFIRLPGAILRALKGRKGSSLFYDITLAMVDDDVKYLRKIIKKANIASDTILIITSDHGVEAGTPYRKDSAHNHTDLSKHFFDEMIHVPFIISGRGIKPKTISELSSQIDIGPTLLSLAGLPVPSEFQGVNIFEREKKPVEFIISENAGNNYCDPVRKPIFISMRTKNYKSTFKIENGLATERDFYDLITDPLELTNQVNSPIQLPLRTRFRQLAEERGDYIKSEYIKLYGA